MTEGAASRMKKSHHIEKPSVPLDPIVAQTQSADALNFLVQDVKFSQEEMWMVEWETRNLKKSFERS
jgi:hypothetical protein